MLVKHTLFQVIGRSGDVDKAAALRSQFASDSLTVPELDALMAAFEKAANDGNHGELGWPNTTYGVSKVGLSALSRWFMVAFSLILVIFRYTEQNGIEILVHI